MNTNTIAHEPTDQYVTPLALVPGTVWDQVGWWEEVRRNTETRWDLGDRLRAERRAVGMSQTALADRLDAHHTQISQWELGQEPIPAHRIRLIEDVLGCCLYAKAA